MMSFLSKNHKNYSLIERKWEMVGTETYQIGGSGSTAGKTYSRNKFDWVEYPTKLHSTSRKDQKGQEFFDKLPSLVIKDKQENVRGYVISCKDTSDFNYYYGGVNTEVKAAIMSYYHYDEVCIRNLTNFVKKIPKKARKKLIKMMFLYDLRKEKDIFAFEMLFSRLRQYFNLSLVTWGCEKTYQFDKIKTTYTVDRNRNRKINRVFKFAKQLLNYGK